MKKAIGIFLSACVLFSMVSCRDNKKAKNFNEKTMVDDQGLAFINAATQSGMVEIKTATIAEQNSKNQRVINFAKMMIEDHSKAGNELKTIAGQKYVTVVDTVSMEHKAIVDSLTKKTGSDFDKLYMKTMVADHEQAVQLFHDAGENKNKAVRDFANKTLPTLKMHLDSAKAINASLK